MQTNKSKFIGFENINYIQPNSSHKLTAETKRYATYIIKDQYGEFVAKYTIDLWTGNFVSNNNGVILWTLKNNIEKDVTEWIGGADVLIDDCETIRTSINNEKDSIPNIFKSNAKRTC